MDFWDLLKTLWHRRWVALPLILLTLGASVYVGWRAEPEYRAIGLASLGAPTLRGVEPVNPWDPQTLAGILVVRMQDSEPILRRLESQGIIGGRYVTTIETSRDQLLPVVRIEVTAGSPSVAQAMVVRLLEVAREIVQAQQEPAKLQPTELITLTTLTSGENVNEVTTTIVRPVVVVALAGLIITAGATVAIDAMARRSGSSSAPTQPMPPTPTPTSPSGRPRPTWTAPPTPPPVYRPSGGFPPPSTAPSTPASLGSGSGDGPERWLDVNRGGDMRIDRGVDRGVDGGRGPVPAPQTGGYRQTRGPVPLDDRFLEDPADATLLLPLTNRVRAARPEGSTDLDEPGEPGTR